MGGYAFMRVFYFIFLHNFKYSSYDDIPFLTLLMVEVETQKMSFYFDLFLCKYNYHFIRGPPFLSN